MPEVIVCPDCGGRASRLSYVPPDGWEVGMVVAYRCADCRDRWDIPIDDDWEDVSRGDGTPRD